MQAENQNRSYVVRSSATFSVIEMPYRNLQAELAANSTSVSLAVLWVSEPPRPVPAWVVALAVLAGLLLLALLIFIMYKVRRGLLLLLLLLLTQSFSHQLGFFKRVRPPQDDCTEKEQLQPEENGNTDA